jgi:outer membrane protein OmpA-like peptidoglycan-associated protein
MTAPFKPLFCVFFATALASGALSAMAQGAIDVGQNVPDAAAIKEGLFPEDTCKDLKEAGFKCMGFKPATKYSLPATTFQVGSAELPETLRKQLDVFAQVLREEKSEGRVVLIEGHADASGTPEANMALSQRRAVAVKAYLVAKGADPAMLQVVGRGSDAPKDPQNPNSAENRRVEIGRAKQP